MDAIVKFSLLFWIFFKSKNDTKCLPVSDLSACLQTLMPAYLPVCPPTPCLLYCTWCLPTCLSASQPITCLRLSALYFLSCLAHGPLVARLLLPVYYSIPFCLSAQWNTCLPACEPTKYLYLPAYCLPAFLPSLLPIPTTS